MLLVLLKAVTAMAPGGSGSHSGGRELLPFMEKHFTKSSERNPTTKHYKFKCNYCPEGSALIEHREKRCLQHIAKPAECQHAPKWARKEAWLILAKDTDIEVEAAAEGGSAATALVIDDDDASNPGTVRPAKKARVVAVRSTLDSFVDRPMTKEEKEKTDLCLLRYALI